MKRTKQIRGFTLMEMLLAMAIVAVMIGLLIPAISKIQTMALVVKQRSQFNAIGIGLEAFYTDSGTGDYPPSSYTKLDGTIVSGTTNNQCYSGAQKLAEALVGWDGFGFHPQSQWRSDGLEDTNGDGTGNVPLYYGSTGFDGLSPEDQAKNLGLRKGPYLELEKANAIKISNLYPTTTNIGNYLATDTYILADMFRKVKNIITGQRTGMPILYFKADTTKTWGTSDAQGVPTTKSSCIYNVENNYAFSIFSKVPWDTTQYHPMHYDTSMSIFYQRIRNPNFPGTAANSFSDTRPYRANSYILLSAGPDGLYGTADDMYNFDENDR
jgi:prepilin-type N-terminal cleavage/methylation domain-containing protein